VKKSRYLNAYLNLSKSKKFMIIIVVQENA